MVTLDKLIMIAHIDEEYSGGDNVVKFWANAKRPLTDLSNFAHIVEGISPFEDKLVFCSSEHAFQSRKYVEEDRVRFSIEGDLGTIDGFALVFPEKVFEQKRDYWMKKGNIGIIAKMATNKTIGKKLKLRRLDGYESSDELWMQILHSKFTIEKFRHTLSSTGDAYLLEFGRSAKREELLGKKPFWCGLIEDGVLYGENKMGKYLMRIRNHIKM